MSTAAIPDGIQPFRYFWQRRRFWLWSVLLVVATVVMFVACLPSTRALASFWQVRAGMTEQDVVALLGQPSNRLRYPIPSPVLGDSALAWYVGELNFFVAYRDGKVIQKRMHTDVLLVRRWFSPYFGRNLL